MKNTIIIALVISLAAVLALEFRYDVVVNSPIVAKIDRMTGDVWIANSGMWLKLKHSQSGACSGAADSKCACGEACVCGEKCVCGAECICKTPQAKEPPADSVKK